MFCPHCGTPVPDAQAQCPNCGKPIALAQPIQPVSPVKKSSNAVIWVIVGCAVVPVLLSIVGIIAAILIPNFLDALQKAKQKRAVSEVQTIGQAVEAYKSLNGYAPAASDMDALVKQLGGAGASLPRVDPWQHAFRYGCWQAESASGCDHYRIVSGGRDGRFDQDDLQAYEPGQFESREYDRDIVFGDGALIAAPGRRAP